MAIINVDWAFDFLAAPLAATATTYTIPSFDGLTSLRITGTGFIYDPLTGRPAGGTISAIQIIVTDGGGVLVDMTNISATLGGLGSLQTSVANLRAQITWQNIIGEPSVVSLSPTLIRLANTDGTFTDIVGTGLDPVGEGNFAGTVSAVRHIAADGTTVLTDLAVSTTLQLVASAIDAFNASSQTMLLLGQGNNTIVVHDVTVGADTYQTGVNDAPGSDSISSPHVSFGYSRVGVVADLAAQTAVVGADTNTLTGVVNVSGSDFNDTLTGNASANQFEAFLGDDVLSGAGGDDVLVGGAGNDTMDGGDGVDTVSYLQGDGATASVTVSLAIAGAQDTGGDGIDTLSNIENVQGSFFNDTLTGDAGANQLDGDFGNDTLNGGAGADVLFGSLGDDILIGGAGADVLNGGSGNADWADYSTSAAGVNVNLLTGATSGGDAVGDTFIDIEFLRGSAQADILTGNTLNNWLFGGLGADQLIGGDGGDFLQGEGDADTLDGGAGIDSLGGGDGDDVLIGGAGADSLGGGAGIDTAAYASSALAVNVNLQTGAATGGDAAGDTFGSVENVIGSAFNDTLIGRDGVANTLSGGGGNDTLNAGAGAIADTLNGNAGDDTLIGGAGADALDGGGGVDTADYSSSGAGVTINLSTVTGTGTGGDAAGDTLVSVENVIGSAFNDVLTGRDFFANVLSGGDGNDVLSGGTGGADVMNGGAGIDTLDYSLSPNGVDVRLFSGAAAGGSANGDTYSSIENIVGAATKTDTLAGDANANMIWGGGGNETITGREGADTLFGEAGNDTLLGGADSDTLIGGIGADTLGGGVQDDLVDYSASDAGVTVNLQTGSGTGGHAQGDVFVSIEDVTGSDFADVIVGKNNVWDNVFDGRGGNDTYTGGLGNDVFVFRAASGADTVTDFSAAAASNNDVVQLIGFGASFDTFAEVIAAASQVGAHTVIDFGSGQTLTLQNVNLASLTSGDFIFG